MKHCNKCENEISEKSVFCNRCGNKISDADLIQHSEEVASSVENTSKLSPSKNKPKLKLFISIISIVVILGASTFIYLNYFTTEAKAKNVVNKYLSAINKGESTYDYKSIGVDDFINVLSYDYLRTQLETKEPVTIDYDIYEFNESYFSEVYDSFDDFKETMKIIYRSNEGYSIRRDSDAWFTLETGEFYDEYRLIYDVELTNGLGQKIYKKVYFVVNNDNSDGNFEITDLFYE
ncbi:hypothetical protein [Chengkuizengella axinellae]|uniref:Zinc ribbon domain-containing protein n=1 Tax=Chengkuizengella axinellae TaxID=3064388 RepID=A0ABT9J6C9_9BACL|nr:hypothetical protein [Chengkuizengella sp. 2205SS18-9]MDP5277159.1 hypothetical protein [Chengkuizengella sp. 2205SS18-9]